MRSLFSTFVRPASLLLLVTAFTAQAQNTWKASGTASWNVAGNWTDNAVPGAGTFALIANGGTSVIGVGVSATARNVLVGRDVGGTLLIDGYLKTIWVGTIGQKFGAGSGIGTVSVQNGGVWDAGGPGLPGGFAAEIEVGTGGSAGSLIILPGGTVNANSIKVGETGGGAGTLYMFGTLNVTETANATLWVGWENPGNYYHYSGTATLRQITVGAGPVTGTATMSAGTMDSQIMIIGDRGTGTFLQTGGLARASAYVNFGLQGGSGTLHLAGGVFEASVFEELSGSGRIKLDGGTLRALKNESDFMQGFESGNVTVDAGDGIIDTNGYSIGISAPLSGDGRLIKVGNGLLTLSGFNTYTGGTTVRSGTLSLSGSSAIIIHDNASLLVGQVAADNAVFEIGDETGLLSRSSIIGDQAGSVGRVTVNGAWTDFSTITVGAFGSGTLQVIDGFAGSSGGIIMGTYSGGQGNATVTSGTLQTYGNFTVGNSGAGTLLINSGLVAGMDSDADIRLGGLAGGTGTVTVNGGTLTTPAAIHVGVAGSGTLVLNSGYISGGAAALGVTGGSGTATVNSGTWAISDTLAVGAQGTGGLTVNGGLVSVTGTTTVAAAPASVGSISLTNTSGTAGLLATRILREGSGSGIVNFNGGVLRALANESAFVSGFEDGDLTTGGAGATVDSGTFAIGIGSGFSGTGGLRKVGAGTLTLAGLSSYSGSTSVQAGKFVFNGTNSGGSAVLVQSGAELGGSGRFSGQVTINNGGILAPGNSAGTLSMGSLILNDTSDVRFELGTVSDLVVVTNGLTLNGLLTVTGLSGFGGGTYTLFQYGGVLTNNGLSLASLPAGYYYSFDFSQIGFVNLIVDEAQYWDGPNTTPNGAVNGGSGTWNNTITNWTAVDGSANYGWTGSGVAVFTGSAGVVNVAETVNVANMDFVTTGYTLTGTGALAISGTSLGVNTGVGVTAGIGTSITGTGTLLKTGDGTLSLTGSNTYGGGTQVVSGTLIAAGAGALSTGPVAVDAATLQINAGLTFSNEITANNGATIKNAGTILRTGFGTGIASTVGDLTVFNTGTINAFKAVVVEGGSLSLENNGGVLTGTSTSITTTTGTANIRNLAGGRIVTGMQLFSGSVLNSGASSIESTLQITNGGSVVNTGTGTKIQSGGYGVHISNGGTVENSNGASIEGSLGIWIDGGGSVLNSGATISGTTDFGVNLTGGTTRLLVNENGGSITGNTSGVRLAGGGTIRNLANSTITGLAPGSLAIHNGAVGAVILENAGTLNGTVLLGSGTHDITLHTGSVINGDLYADIDTASILRLTGTGTQIYSAVVTGSTIFSGTLIKEGVGSWIVDQDFDGSSGVQTAGVKITNGILVLGNSGTTGSVTGAIDIAAPGGLGLNRADSFDFGNAISGNGGLLQMGSGTVTIATANTGFSGLTSISNGILRTTVATALGSSSVALSGGSLAPVGQLDIAALNWTGGTIASVLGTNTSFVNIAGNLSLTGTGQFEFMGDSGFLAETPYAILGATNLSGFGSTDFSANTPVGLTSTFTVVGNTLFVSFLGSSTGPLLQNSGPVFTPTSADFLVSGAVQTGSPAQSNIVNSMTFENGSSLQVFNNLTVTSGLFDVPTGRASLNGGNVITPGDFNKNGQGALITNTNFQVGGAANINAGFLIVNGKLTANAGVTVAQNALLGGSGVISGDVFNNGIVSPGNSPGTLTFFGNFTQSSSGLLQIEVGDLLIVSGRAALDGALQVLASKLKYGQQLAFLQAGSISGEFDKILMPNPSKYRGRFLVEGGTGILLVAPTSYTLVAESQNQKNVAKALDSFITQRGNDQEAVSIALDLQSEEQYPAAFDQIAPSFYESLADITIEQINAQNQNLAQRASALRLGARGFQAIGIDTPLVHDKNGKSVMDAKDGKNFLSPAPDNKWGVWVQGNGNFARATSVSQVPSYNFESGGFLAGADYRWSENFVAGLYGGYLGTFAKYSNGGKTTINSVQFGGYASYDNGGFYADGIVGGGFSAYAVRRPIKFSTIDRTATSRPDGGQLTTYLGLGYDWKVGNLTIGPILSGQYTYAGITPFTENGADSLNLSVAQQNANSLRTSLGGRIAYTWKLTDSITLIPEGRMFWQHEFLENPRNIGASLDGGNGPSFGYTTSTPDRDAAFAGAGIIGQFGPNWNAYFYYNADFGRQDYISHAISTGLNFKF